MPRPQMITDDTEPSDNLPPPVSGALPQAQARKNARRGGTPNAPEVDDEAAPASNNGSAAPQTPAQPAPPTIAAPQTSGSLVSMLPGGRIAEQVPGEVASAYRTGGVGAALGEAARGTGAYALGTVADLGQSAINVVKPWWNVAAGAAKTAFTGDQQPLAPTPARTPEPGPGQTPGATPPPSVANLPPVEARPSNVPDSTPVRPAPPGYTGVGGVGAPAGAIAAPAMTTEQANQFYGAQNEAMKAKEAQDLDENRARSMETTNKGVAAYQADQIRHGTELFHARNVLAQGGLVGAGGALATARDLTGEAAGLEKFARAPSAIPQRNLIGEQAGQAAAVQTQQQNALMNPLHVAQLQQGLAAGGTAQKIAELTLEGHKTDLDIRRKMAESTDPQEQLRYQNMLLSGQGKPPIEPWKLHVSEPRYDPISGTYTAGRAVAMHAGTGEIKSITSDITPQPSTTKLVEGAQFKGRAGTPDEGKFFKVINGQHVETDAAGNPLKK